MATIEQCREALKEFAGNLGDMDDSNKKLVRTVSLKVPDLDVTFHGTLREGTLEDVTTEPRDRAQIRLTINSDDLVSLVAGQLNFAAAWARGRVKLEASFSDLLRLRKLL
ncbi:alkyl sulfatase C-terminal domain-containing protein [Catenulispora pinisilvae]|uniref:alkyl sulfatase C-terminal domain-containing protein n=1 Tax=Catenulispora pinisilvae TaxID=2705253 RepID=UPI001891066F|nr:alkyl sulfatase C-terminal domain-containing protein [Catenulispora pinisilvae]